LILPGQRGDIDIIPLLSRIRTRGDCTRDRWWDTTVMMRLDTLPGVGVETNILKQEVCKTIPTIQDDTTAPLVERTSTGQKLILMINTIRKCSSTITLTPTPSPERSIIIIDLDHTRTSLPLYPTEVHHQLLPRHSKSHISEKEKGKGIT
jgi:hypothetical protein